MVSESHAPSLPATILGSFRNPFVLLLIVLAAIMVATNDHIGASTITVMVLISVGLNTTQEYKATRAAQALRAMVVATTTVIRQGKASEIPVAQASPATSSSSRQATLIPADLRLCAPKT